MNDKQTRQLIIVILLALLGWWAIKNKSAASNQTIVETGQTAPETAQTPMNQYFANNPQLFLPQPAQIDVNIGNQGINYLSSATMPMFGFVGIAQGNVYQ